LKEAKEAYKISSSFLDSSSLTVFILENSLER
jgi:hypothetical protein